MPAAITLKNIPDDIYERLKASAAAHHRSLNKEAIACLEQVLTAPHSRVEETLARAKAIRESLAPRKFKASDIRRAIKQGRL